MEGQAYPRLSRTLYAYVDLGYSATPVYSAWRSGAELFAALPRAWEASGGYRQLRFAGSPVTLFTGSLGHYAGDYWYAVRPWIRTGGVATSGSLSAAARRYAADAVSAAVIGALSCAVRRHADSLAAAVSAR